MNFFRTTFALGVIGSLGFALVPGCGGDDNKSGGGGGGSDASADVTTGNKDGAVDAPSDTASGGSCPTYTGNAPYCKALVSYCNKCNHQLTACALQNFTSYCEGVSSAFSATAANALAQCGQNASCAQDAGSGNQCLNQALASATPTAAQQKVSTDFCAGCPSDAGNCVADFYYVATDGGKSGVGSFVLAFNDTIANQIDRQCTGANKPDAGALGWGVGFAFCALGVLQAALPKNPCGDAAFADPIVAPSTLGHLHEIPGL